MGKKKNSMSLLYLIGMIAVVVGCFLPIIEVKLGPLGSIKTNVIRAFQSLDSANSWWQLLMFVAAIVGAVLSLVSVKNGNLIKLVALMHEAGVPNGVVLYCVNPTHLPQGFPFVG